ncbi:hypothetical protein TNIN_207761 [Trichonephila inaurata madagascariensis]|uniref:Uncharacterized protein n=1 Tax=Trichonephila inaurata madagascariensis TaxID=2747483 RepID=A0A8X6WRC6_9ARAC|nr:hypothetical protein TNIN_207761 [Trichonephila inaurata madagascariensis]
MVTVVWECKKCSDVFDRLGKDELNFKEISCEKNRYDRITTEIKSLGYDAVHCSNAGIKYSFYFTNKSKRCKKFNKNLLRSLMFFNFIPIPEKNWGSLLCL